MHNSEDLYTDTDTDTNEQYDLSIATKQETDLCIERALLSVNLNSIKLKGHLCRKKRILDLVGAMGGMIFLGLLYPFIALGIKLSSSGPVMFIQDRTGKNGRVFKCYKFRTMHTGISKRESKNQPVVTEVGDRRIFAFGNFLRKSNLDELPQIINIIKGDMSLVGPRPLPIDECHHWRSTIPNFELRYAVKPGLTGWAQVTGYRGGTLDVKHMVFRLKRDFKYIENYSVTLDFKIIGKTLKQMIIRDTKAH